MAKRTLVGKGREGPRGRLKVAPGPHARLGHAYTHAYSRVAHAHDVHTSLQHGRVQRRSRARVRGVCVCGQYARASASVVIRRSYGGSIMSSYSCVGKTELWSSRSRSRKYIRKEGVYSAILF